jgi:hypothetical protein
MRTTSMFKPALPFAGDGRKAIVVGATTFNGSSLSGL